MTAKAYNNRIIVEWLARVAKQAADLRPHDHQLRCQYVAVQPALWRSLAISLRTSLSRFLNLAERFPRFLQPGSVAVTAVSIAEEPLPKQSIAFGRDALRAVPSPPDEDLSGVGALENQVMGQQAAQRVPAVVIDP